MSMFAFPITQINSGTGPKAVFNKRGSKAKHCSATPAPNGTEDVGIRPVPCLTMNRQLVESIHGL